MAVNEPDALEARVAELERVVRALAAAAVPEFIRVSELASRLPWLSAREWRKLVALDVVPSCRVAGVNARVVALADALKLIQDAAHLDALKLREILDRSRRHTAAPVKQVGARRARSRPC